MDRMFAKKMKEATSRKLIMEDVQGSSIKAFLSFLYPDNVGQEEINDTELIFFTDKYEVPGLLKLSLTRLPYMESKTVIDVLVVADRHNCKELKEEALRKVGAEKETFINDKYFRSQMSKVPYLLFDIMSLQYVILKY